jgi:hypothetical protein
MTHQDHFWDHLLAFLCQVLPDDMGPVLPHEAGPVLPDDMGPVLPDDAGPVLPHEASPVLPDDMGPVLPDGFAAPTALPADSGMPRSFPLFAAAYRAFSYPGVSRHDAMRCRAARST